MSKFYSLSVSEVAQETNDCVSISFAIPQDLKNEFAYKQGQYITFKLNVDGAEIRRSYSVCSSPVVAEDIRVAVKRVTGGKGSNYLNSNVKVGDKLEIMQPMGNFFTEMNSSNQNTYVLFAGGSGITPMMSILKTVLLSEPNSKVVLYYGNQNESSIIFHKQLNELSASHADRFKIVHIIERPDNTNHPKEQTGMMTPDVVQVLAKPYAADANAIFFICGPTPMMQSVESTLQNLNVPKSQVHLEYFTAPVDADAKELSSSGNCTATIILDGDTFTVEVAAGENILDAAINAGLDAPYACQGGSCCTCRALLTDGKVEMKVNYALLDQEVKEGFILTCQSVPQTPTVTVNYDRGR
jgi:ring-1,2-phenylacetyl-CoA epoxidase subunit PaaE